MLATNRKVIDLMRSFGPTKSTGLEPGVVMLEIELLDTKGLGVFLQGALREAATGALEGRDPALRQPRARARPRSG